MAGGFKGLWEAVFGWLSGTGGTPITIPEVVSFNLDILRSPDFVLTVDVNRELLAFSCGVQRELLLVEGVLRIKTYELEHAQTLKTMTGEVGEIV